MSGALGTSSTSDGAQSALPALIGFLFASACACLPLALHSALPLEDLPNHMARHHVMANPDVAALQGYYEISAAIVPNSAVDLLWRLTGYPVAVEQFSRIITGVQGVMLVAAVMLLARVLHGRWTAWSAASGLFLWNAQLLFGLQNFTFTLPFALLALALWLAAERWPLWQRVMTFLPITLLLYVMHFFGFAVLAIAVFGRQLQQLLQSPGPRGPLLATSLALAVPFLLPLGWLLFDIAFGPANPAGSLTTYDNIAQRPFLLLTPFLDAYGDGSAWFTWTGAAAGLLVLACLLTLLIRRTGARLVLDDRLKGPVLALLVACLLVPEWLNGVATVHLRLPLPLLAILLAGTRWVDAPRPALRALAALTLTLMAARSVAFERLAAVHEAEISQLRHVLAALPPASRMLPLHGEGRTSDSRLGHADAYAVIDRNAFVPGLFQGVHTLGVRAAWRDHAHASIPLIDECAAIPGSCPTALRADFTYNRTGIPLTFLDRWPCKFTHVLAMDRPARFVARLPFLTGLRSDGRFALFRVDLPPGTDCATVLAAGR